MTARLRELAGLQKIVREAAEVLQMVADSGVMLPPNWRWPLADELSGFAYLLMDAEGDGGDAGNADVMVCQIGDYAELDKRAWATVIYDDKKVAECYTNEDAELVGAALRVYSTHPARSGGVSDAECREFLSRLPLYCSSAPIEMVRTALTHFAKGADVGGDAEDAARYRWLRENGYDLIGEDRGNGPTFPEGDGLDQAIDDARKGERHE